MATIIEYTKNNYITNEFLAEALYPTEEERCTSGGRLFRGIPGQPRPIGGIADGGVFPNPGVLGFDRGVGGLSI